MVDLPVRVAKVSRVDAELFGYHPTGLTHQVQEARPGEWRSHVRVALAFVAVDLSLNEDGQQVCNLIERGRLQIPLRKTGPGSPPSHQLEGPRELIQTVKYHAPWSSTTASNASSGKDTSGSSRSTPKWKSMRDPSGHASSRAADAPSVTVLRSRDRRCRRRSRDRLVRRHGPAPQSYPLARRRSRERVPLRDAPVLHQLHTYRVCSSCPAPLTACVAICCAISSAALTLSTFHRPLSQHGHAGRLPEADPHEQGTRATYRRTAYRPAAPNRGVLPFP